MIAPLGSLTEGVPHGYCNSSDQSGSSLAVGAGGGPQAQRGGTHRYLLPSAPRPCPLLWPWGRGAAPGDAGWPACPLEGGGTSGGTGDVPLPPAWLDVRLAPCLPAGADARGTVCGASEPGVWRDRASCPRCL